MSCGAPSRPRPTPDDEQDAGEEEMAPMMMLMMAPMAGPAPPPVLQPISKPTAEPITKKPFARHGMLSINGRLEVIVVTIHGPLEILDYSHDWSAWLLAGDDADQLASSVWTISPTGPTLVDQGYGVDDNLATVKVAGLVLDLTYTLRNVVTSLSGMTGERTWTLRCAKR